MNVLRPTYNAPAAVAKPAWPPTPPQPLPTLARPVLCVCGGTSRAMGLKYVINYLTADGNNTFGGVFNADRPQELDNAYRKKPGNVFSLEYTRQFGTMEHNADELRAAVDAIRKLTGAAEVDVVAECKAAIETREAIRTGLSGVRNVVLLVPPNRGLTVEGNLAWLASKLPFLKKVAKIELQRPDARQALKQFCSDVSVGPFHANPLLHRLNTPENLEREKAAVHSLTVISGTGNAQMHLPMPILAGDSWVPEWSAFKSNAKNFYFEGHRSRHGQVQSHPAALAKIAETLTTDGNPAEDVSFRASVPSPVRIFGETTLTLGAFAGRVNAIGHLVAGAALGPLGMALGTVGAGVSFLDAGRHLVAAARTNYPHARQRAVLGALGRLAQGLGTVAAMHGAPLPGLALASLGFIGTVVAGASLPPDHYDRHRQPPAA